MSFAAELSLQGAESQSGYPLLVLKLVQDSGVDANIRFAAVLLFKNYVKKNWPKVLSPEACQAIFDDLCVRQQEEGEAIRVSEADRTAIKQDIVNLMINVPEKLQVQLSDAVYIIADNDFPHAWGNLIQVPHTNHPWSSRITKLNCFRNLLANSARPITT
jgi:exportin-2 (importin alpha re-exporter)